MNCLKCGFENPDGAKFCNCCGVELENRVISEEQLNDRQPEEMYDAVPAEQESAFQLNMEGNQPEKRRSPVGIILAAVGVLLVAAVLVMLLVPACRAFVVRTFQSPEKLMYNVYSEAVSGAMENVDTAALEQKASSKTDTHLLLGDQVVSLAASANRPGVNHRPSGTVQWLLRIAGIVQYFHTFHSVQRDAGSRWTVRHRTDGFRHAGALVAFLRCRQVNTNRGEPDLQLQPCESYPIAAAIIVVFLSDWQKKKWKSAFGWCIIGSEEMWRANYAVSEKNGAAL